MKECGLTPKISGVVGWESLAKQDRVASLPQLCQTPHPQRPLHFFVSRLGCPSPRILSASNHHVVLLPSRLRHRERIQLHRHFIPPRRDISTGRDRKMGVGGTIVRNSAHPATRDEASTFTFLNCAHYFYGFIARLIVRRATRLMFLPGGLSFNASRYLCFHREPAANLEMPANAPVQRRAAQRTARCNRLLGCRL